MNIEPIAHAEGTVQPSRSALIAPGHLAGRGSSSTLTLTCATFADADSN
jgi:hypothetical protein